MRRAHATSPGQLATLPLGGVFDPNDIAFDAERACVVVPFRETDDEGVVAAPRALRDLLRLRSRERYAPWRRWLLIIYGALEYEIDSDPENAEIPWDFLDVSFDSEYSEVVITCDGPSLTGVSARVERIDVVVEETAEQLGWGLVHPRWDAAVLAAPPPGSRPIVDRLAATSRMGALLRELCGYGWCLPLEDRRALEAAGPQDRETVVDSIIRAECGEDDVRDEDTRAFLRPIVDDWLFDPTGRGARSGLPL
jgi:hypothetical protein